MQTGVEKDSEKISSMFNNIAKRYDFLNHLLSFGVDRYWRWVLIRDITSSKPKRALDIATGTGDLAIAMYKNDIECIGIDIAEKMIDNANIKCTKLKESNIPKPSFLVASADNIPFPSNHFELVTIAFGIRNFENRKQALEEIHRVLAPGGKLSILEFTTPKNPIWRGLYNFYFHNILPLIGRLISKELTAYHYLPQSVKDFPQYKSFCEELACAGFINNTFKPLTGGISTYYKSVKDWNR